VTDIAVEQPIAGDTLVQRAAAGDEIAFARLIAEHNASMARVAYVICGDRETTLDCVQSAWTTAWRKLGSLRDPAQVRSWLISIAANEARMHMRRKRRAVVVDISDAMSAPAQPDPDFAKVMDLERALRGLNADERRLLALRFVADLDSTQIAHLLGASPSGVRSRLARLLHRLRAELEPGAER
jgi:RNA polymerase sigma-70 factor (ECF subfamily)